MTAKLFTCCTRVYESELTECFQILCFSTVGSNIVPGCDDGPDESVRRMSLDKCSLLVHELESVEAVSKKDLLKAQGIVFLLNSAGNKMDVDKRVRMMRSIQEHPALHGTPFLLLATHQGKSSAVSCDQLEVLLDLGSVRASRCLVMHCCAGADPDDLLLGFERLANELLKRHYNATRKIKKSRHGHSITELTTKTIETLRGRRRARNMRQSKDSDYATPNGIDIVGREKVQLRYFDNFKLFKP